MIKKYHIKNLDCASCAQKVEDLINKRSDVRECSLSFANGLLVIESDNEIDIKDLEQAIQKIEPEVVIDYKDQKTQTNDEHEHNNCTCEHDHEKHEDDSCGCSHEHAKHNHDSCECNHEHDEHDHCGCGHHHDEDIHDDKIIETKGVVSYSISGLDCASCAMKVESAIKNMDNVNNAVLNFSTETLKVQFIDDKKQSLDSMQKVVDSVEDGVTLTLKSSHKVIEKPKLFNLKENFSLIAGVIVYIGSIILQSQSISVVGFVAAYILIGHEVLLKALRNILRRDIFDENFLMAIATIGAFAIGDYAEAVAVLLFYSVGEIFQSFAVNKTRSSISELMDIKSEYASIKTSDGIKKVTPEEVNVNDEIIVKVGEKIPLDGVIISGQSSLDTSSLTGESLPREVNINDEVLAGVVNLTAIIEVRVTKPYVDSTVSKILELMENAASKKAPIEKFITRFARIYTPTVVVLAIMLAVVPMFIFNDAVFTEWLYRALTFLVVSCPCALVISVPLGIYAGLGKASKVGALIKGGNYLELLKNVDTVVFDKTGTLTYGSFDVVEVNGDNNLLKIGAYGEYFSNHPIAKSIVKKYNQNIDESKINNFKEIAGKGIDVELFDQHVYLGNAAFLKEHQIDVIEPKEVGTVIFIAIDNQFAGSIVVADQIKESAIKGIAALKRVGVSKTVMLTGDRQQVANDVAKKLGVDIVYSELLPQDKVTQVEKMLDKKEGYIAFVGDGINDAPVLARADVGIAMGGVGSDAAIEAADVVLMQDNIETISEAIKISHKTNSILIQNVTFTLIIKIGVLLLTMFGYSNMWMGVFADVGVTLIAICNAMRVLR